MNLSHRYTVPFLLLAAGFAGALPSAARDRAEAAYTAAVRTTPLLRTTTDVAGTPIVYPARGAAEVTGVLVELPTGAETGWHKHTVPCFAYILGGEIAVAQRDGPTRTFRAGDAFAELIGIEHNGRTIGTGPVRLVFFAAGVQGEPFTVKDAPGPASTP